MGDDTLISRYLRNGNDDDRADSDCAFRDLTAKYVGLVMGVAMRRTGQHEIAEEIAQTVFTILARKAHQLTGQSSIAGWLHRATMLESAKAMRSEYRRHRKMKKFIDQQAILQNAASVPVDEETLPVIDEALHRLSASDRDVILQRYFEDKSYREIAAATGATQAACEKRCSRALARLGEFLRRRGIAASGAMLGVAIASRLAHVPPAGFASALATKAVAGLPSTYSLFVAMNSMKLATITALIVASATVPMTIQWANSQRSAAAMTADAVLRSSELVGAAVPGNGAVGHRLDLAALERELARLPQSDIEAKLVDLMFALTAAEIPGVVDLVMQAENPRALFSVARALFARWAEIDPQAAAATLEEISFNDLKTGARAGALATWLASNPKAALAHMAELLTVNDKEFFQLDNAYPLDAWVADDPQAALTQVNAWIDDRHARNKLIMGIMRVWAKTDPEGAFAHSQSIGDEAVSLEMQVAILDRVWQTHPDKVISLAASAGFRSGMELYVGLAMGMWCERDPVAAVNAYLELPDSFRAANTIPRLAAEFARSDPERALMIASRLPENERQPWTLFSAQQLADSDPAMAVSIVESLPDDLHFRSNVLRRIAERWMRSQPDEAGEWIRNSNHFDAQAREDLLTYEL
ncbi:MAG: sigma-70 family RNA polymerase sigma factor [Verrucomicrobiae bacterium]|nr:sigma-70 family RNA polymerase sigma factor [Verrucomicrobiae bacterium]